MSGEVARRAVRADRRHRLVAAFGFESRAAPLVAGVVCAVLLVVGGSVGRLVHAPPPAGWDDGHLVVVSSSGTRYVSREGVLHPVLNLASARLALPSGSGGRTAVVVGDDVVAKTPRGAPIGIAGAPDVLPSQAALDQSGWTACLDGTAVHTTIGGPPAGTSTSTSGDGSVVLRDGVDGTRYLVAGAHRYRIAPSRYDAVKQYLDHPAAPSSAPRSWLALWPTGSDLAFASFRFPAGSAPGAALPAAVTAAGVVRQVGQLVENTDRDGAMSVVVADGSIPLTPFAAAVYRATAPGGLAVPVPVTDRDLARIQASAAGGFVPADWPTPVPAAADPRSTTSCARLETRDGQGAVTRLVVGSATSAEEDGPAGGSAAGGVTVGGVTVEPGGGAVVRTGTGGDDGPVYLVDESGRAFPVADPADDTLGRLGYSGLTPRLVPAAWVALLPAGPALSEKAAGAT